MGRDRSPWEGPGKGRGCEGGCLRASTHAVPAHTVTFAHSTPTTLTDGPKPQQRPLRVPCVAWPLAPTISPCLSGDPTPMSSPQASRAPAARPRIIHGHIVKRQSCPFKDRPLAHQVLTFAHLPPCVPSDLIRR
jgi:hypothetical protein